MSLVRDVFSSKIHLPKRKKEKKTDLSLDQINLGDIEDPDNTTRKLLIDLEDFSISHYITTRVLMNLLISKGIITIEEFKQEKEKIMKLQDIKELITNLNIHKELVREDMNDGTTI